MSTVPWSLCCFPLENGGLGVKSLQLLNQLMLEILPWTSVSGEDWFSRLLH